MISFFKSLKLVDIWPTSSNWSGQRFLKCETFRSTSFLIRQPTVPPRYSLPLVWYRTVSRVSYVKGLIYSLCPGLVSVFVQVESSASPPVDKLGELPEEERTSWTLGRQSPSLPLSLMLRSVSGFSFSRCSEWWTVMSPRAFSAAAFSHASACGLLGSEEEDEVKNCCQTFWVLNGFPLLFAEVNYSEI